MSKVDLPAVLPSTSPVLDQLTKAFGVPRSVLASDEEIQHAWAELPRALTKIAPERLLRAVRADVRCCSSWPPARGCRKSAQAQPPIFSTRDFEL